MKEKPIDARIARAAELAVRARIQLDLSRLLRHRKSLGKHRVVEGQHWEYLRFAREAHEWTFFLRCDNLFDKRRDTDNLPRILELLRASGEVSAQVLTECERLLRSVARVSEGVHEVRNKAVGHQSDRFTQPAVFRMAGLTLNNLVRLSSVALQISRKLCAARGLPLPRHYPSPVISLKSLLVSLREVDASSDQRFI